MIKTDMINRELIDKEESFNLNVTNEFLLCKTELISLSHLEKAEVILYDVL